jgi:hypothetical protein
MTSFIGLIASYRPGNPQVSAMQQFNKIARGFLSPPVLLTLVWSAVLVGIIIGPIDYPSLPSLSTLALVTTGLLLFFWAHCGGVWSCAFSLRHWPSLPPASFKVLNVAVGMASVAGLIGIALIALDRTVLSGVSNSGYAALLRCAPGLVDYIEIKRTPLLYLGYLSFSFGFAALALFLLKGEEIEGWAAYLGQLSVISPVGYALLYSGRMPILSMIALIASVVMVRLARRLPAFPRGHHLLVKIVVLVVLFGIYSNAMWSSRRNFCIEMQDLVQNLLTKMEEQRSKSRQALLAREAELKQKLATVLSQAEGTGANAEEIETVQHALSKVANDLVQSRRPPGGIDAVELSTKIEGVTPKATGAGTSEIDPFLDVLRESWHVAPRQYVLSALDSGYLSPTTARALLSNYFYLTHGVRILDLIWHSRAQLSPLWGVYEIGVLSPILRVFFPDNQLLTTMNNELTNADIYGFFPTVWGAAIIDFGALGAVIYVLLWGWVSGWSYYGTKHSTLTTPPLLLTFTLASIILSPIQGPLGAANSALVLVSMLLLGFSVDLWTLRSRNRVDVSGR